jgi:hypothetical protein
VTPSSGTPAARRIALGLELGVATARDLTGENGAPGPTVADQIAHIGLQLLTILADGPAVTAQQSARDAFDRLMAWKRAGIDGRGLPLTPPERQALDRLSRDVAESLAHAFGYTRDERVAVRTTLLGEDPATAAERTRQQDIAIAAGHSVRWRWSLGEDTGDEPCP